MAVVGNWLDLESENGRDFGMFKRIVCFMVAVGGVAAAAEVIVKDFTIPEFDTAGHLIRQLHAASATGPLDAPKLINGVVDFFAPKGAGSEKLGTLDLADAT